MTETVEAVQQTLAEYERLAIETSEWNGTEIEFSNNGESWAPVLLPTETSPHPLMARATVHRKGVAVPTVVVVLWDEAVPAEDSWNALWQRKPHILFGSYAARAALRRAFRDVIGDRREPDEIDPPAPVDADVDWGHELAQAATAAAVNELHQRAKLARAVTPQLEVALRERLTTINGGPPPKPVVAKPRPPRVRPEDTVKRRRASKPSGDASGPILAA